MGRISKLHKYTLDKINSKFPHLKARENYYPDWLTSPNGTRLELDIYIDDLNIAAEIQGSQHSCFVPFFHATKEDFEKQKQYDEHKKIICRSEGVRLYDIATEQDADIMIYEIEEAIRQKESDMPKYYYQLPSEYETKRSRKMEAHRQVELLKSQGLFVSRKQRKAENVNSNEEIEKRLEKCKENIFQYESGNLEAPEYKYLYWKQVVENNGIALTD